MTRNEYQIKEPYTVFIPFFPVASAVKDMDKLWTRLAEQFLQGR